MKKFLLSLASAVLAVSGAFAEEATFNFNTPGDVYGLTWTKNTAPTPDIETPKTITQDFVNITFNPTTEGGYALAGSTTASGLWFCSGTTDPSITVSVDGGTITEVVLNVATYENRVYVGDVEVPGEAEGYSAYISTWTGASNSITFGFTPAGSGKYDGYRINNITVTYSFASADQKNPELSFTEQNATGIAGEAFTAPELVNPHDLPIVWSSSNESVATVDANGNVTLIGGGKTTITAFTEGNKDYASGFASYEIAVTPRAANCAELRSLAPEFGDKVLIGFPMNVTFVDDEEVWVVDESGNAAYIKGENEYKVGSVIPQGWMASNVTSGGDIQWTGELPASTSEVEIAYPEVSIITSEDHARVLWLKGVTLDSTFGEVTEEGTQPMTVNINGRDVILFNTFGIAAQEAGVYDILGVVDYKAAAEETYLYFYPIQYVAGQVSVPMVEKNEVIDFTKVSDSSTYQPVEIPYEIKGQAVTVTLENASEGFDYQISQKGILVNGPEKNAPDDAVYTVRVAGNDNRPVTKVVLIVENYFDTAVIGGTSITDKFVQINGKWYTSYTWERPESYSANDVDLVLTIKTSKWGTNPVTFSNIEVYYLEESNGLELANLAVKQKNVTVSVAEGTYDAASNIENPKSVALSWTSSDPEVAAVTDNGLELKGEGTATITAEVASEGFEADAVSFEINVVNAAMSLVQLETLAPNSGDSARVYKGLAFYVAATATGPYKVTEISVDEEGNETEKEVTHYENFIFAEDINGNPALLFKNKGTSLTTYRTDDILEGGWNATNEVREDVKVWAGAPTPASRAQSWFNFSTVETLNGLKENKVVVLSEVNLTNGAPAEKGTFKGTLSNGDEITLLNLVTTSQKENGIYDITGALGKTVNGEEVFYPISYVKKDGEIVGVEAIEAADAEVTYFNLQGVEVKNPAPGVYIKVVDEKATKVIIR